MWMLYCHVNEQYAQDHEEEIVYSKIAESRSHDGLINENWPSPTNSQQRVCNDGTAKRHGIRLVSLTFVERCVRNCDSVSAGLCLCCSFPIRGL